MIHYSFIIPVYNRPQEIQELLESLTNMEFSDSFEIVIIEDGSSETAEEIVSQFSRKLDISYYFKPNSGPGDSRNYGMKKAKGNYFIIFDSDCLIPSHYLQTVHDFLSKTFYHCFGGADAAHESFTPLQKAINYVMTSFLTTGGIRGSEKSIQKFEPRSFNMGISKEAFEKTGGFGKIHPGEDPDLSQRIREAGFETTFIPRAFVYHKRRISWKTFYRQVTKFGLTRPILNHWHPVLRKPTFWLPSLFVIFTLLSVVLTLWIHWVLIIPLAVYILAIFLDSSLRNRSVYIGFLTIPAVFIQFFGYGLGFIKSYWWISIRKKEPREQFPSLFFD